MESNNTGRKISACNENPIDNIFIEISDKYLSKKFNEKNISPNTVTLISLFLGILACVCFVYEKYIATVFFLQLSYLFDCVDGNLARKYNKATDFGDYLDHLCDFFKFFLFACVFMYSKNNINFKCKFLAVYLFIILFFIMSIHYGCQEELSIYKQNNNFLKPCKKLPFVSRKNITVTRFFGSGTFYLILCIYILMI